MEEKFKDYIYIYGNRDSFIKKVKCIKISMINRDIFYAKDSSLLGEDTLFITDLFGNEVTVYLNAISTIERGYIYYYSKPGSDEIMGYYVLRNTEIRHTETRHNHKLAIRIL